MAEVPGGQGSAVEWWRLDYRLQRIAERRRIAQRAKINSLLYAS